MTASIQVRFTPRLVWLLRIADTALIQAQRLSEWCGHAPVLEEDIALTNIALDLIGQSRALLTLAGRWHGQDGGTAYDEDQLAFLRDERDFRNLTLAELPRGDFAFATLRNLLLATWFKLQWERLRDSRDEELAAIAAKALKEARYHQQHAADWLLRLADGTAESRRRTEAALAELWRFVPELLAADEADLHAQSAGLGPSRAALREAWEAEIAAVFGECGLALPAAGAFTSTASCGVHTEHMGRLLAEMQQLQRAYPGGVW